MQETSPEKLQPILIEKLRSGPLKPNAQSPCRQITGLSGLLTLAAMLKGTPVPTQPATPASIRCLGYQMSITWRLMSMVLAPSATTMASLGSTSRISLRMR